MHQITCLLSQEVCLHARNDGNLEKKKQKIFLSTRNVHIWCQRVLVDIGVQGFIFEEWKGYPFSNWLVALKGFVVTKSFNDV